MQGVDNGRIHGYNNSVEIIIGGYAMKSVIIKLPTVEAVRTFVDVVRKYDADIDLSSGRYIVDAKSIMGIFSLDLINPIKLTAHMDNTDALFEEIKDFIIDTAE